MTSKAGGQNDGPSYDYGRVIPGSNGFRDGPPVSKITSNKIEFNMIRTKAPEKVMDIIIEALNDAESRKKSTRQKYDLVNRNSQSKIGGVWMSIDTSEFNPAKGKNFSQFLLLLHIRRN